MSCRRDDRSPEIGRVLTLVGDIYRERGIALGA